jgi:hypothetical protein
MIKSVQSSAHAVTYEPLIPSVTRDRSNSLEIPTDLIDFLKRSTVPQWGETHMKSMLVAFAAIALIADYTLDNGGFSAKEQATGSAVRLN